MGQTVTATITGYDIHIQQMYLDASDRSIEVVALVSDANGDIIGDVRTNIYIEARNLPVALIKAYFLRRKIDNGTLVPEANL